MPKWRYCTNEELALSPTLTAVYRDFKFVDQGWPFQFLHHQTAVHKQSKTNEVNWRTGDFFLDDWSFYYSDGTLNRELVYDPLIAVATILAVTSVGEYFSRRTEAPKP
jgi:hypothetical protein